MPTPAATRLLRQCTRRPDGLMLSRDHRYLADAAGIFRTLVRHGVLLKLSRGAFVEAEKYLPLPDWGRYNLDARAVGAAEGRILAGYSAAAVHGLWRYLPVPASHTIYRRSTGHRIRTGPALVELHAELPGHHRTTVDSQSVTTIERTIVDLTRVHGFGAGFVAACGALRAGRASIDGIRAHAQGRRGVTHLPLLLEHATPLVESALESIFLAQTVFFGGFEVIPQVEVEGESGRKYRVDFQVEGTDQFVELDGGGKYGSAEAEQRFVLAKEKTRSDELVRASVRMNRFGYRDVVGFHAYRGMLHRLELPPRPHLPPIHFP